MRLTNGILCCPDGLTRDLDLIVHDGMIALEKRGASGGESIDLKGAYVLPGFIELHTHGAGLFDFTLGRYDIARKEFDSSEEIYAEDLPKYVRLRTSTGVTSGFLGTFTTHPDQQRLCLRMLKKYMESGRNGKDGCFIHGGSLEGPFINPANAGAQDPSLIVEPDVEFFNKVDESGIIKLVNVVPDYGEKSYILTQYLTSKGISVGAGHTRATYDQVKRCVGAGLKYFIHLLNGPTGGSFKSFDGGGAIEAALKEDVYTEIICDGMHVAPVYFREVLARKGVDRVLAVSDAVFVSQAEGVGEFSIEGIPGRVDDGGKFAYVVGSDPLALYGSVTTMDAIFGNILSWLTEDMVGIWHPAHDALSFEEAVGVAARCCSKNAVDMIKSRGGEDLRTGELANGKWADLTIAEINGDPGKYDVQVKQVFVRGEKVWDACSEG
jgi:N-acetylglucosamine-6-phosphate deacetylase